MILFLVKFIILIIFRYTVQYWLLKIIDFLFQYNSVNSLTHNYNKIYFNWNIIKYNIVGSQISLNKFT